MEEIAIAVVAFSVLEKLVKLSPCKWDDIVIDGIKSIFTILKK
tara:strand:+ start:70 stop:198 length:129 start_codon:yes stop_codon:yes gene_type:complete